MRPRVQASVAALLVVLLVVTWLVVRSGGTRAQLTPNGVAWAWGDNGVGQLGPNCATGTCSAPIQIGGLTNVAAVAAGSVHTLVLAADGTLWGRGDHSSSPPRPN